MLECSLFTCLLTALCFCRLALGFVFIFRRSPTTSCKSFEAARQDGGGRAVAEELVQASKDLQDVVGDLLKMNTKPKAKRQKHRAVSKQVKSEHSNIQHLVKHHVKNSTTTKKIHRHMNAGNANVTETSKKI
jgi:hypothetical protein